MRKMFLAIVILGATLLLVGCLGPTYVTGSDGRVIGVVYPPPPVTMQVRISTGSGGASGYYQPRRCWKEVVGVKCNSSYRRSTRHYQERSHASCHEVTRTVCR